VRALRFRDKYLQKRALPASVPRADCVYATPRSSFTDLADRLGTPFVLKPANGFGAARTVVVRSADDVERFWSAGTTGSAVEVVAESYVGGDEVHLDGLWRGGRLAWSSLSAYLDPPLQWNDGGILADGIVGRDAEPELYAEVDALAWRALGALDAPDCVFHLEAYRGREGQPHAGRLVFGECAIRLGGAMVPEVIRLTHGVDLYEVALSLALGEDVDIAPAAPPEHYYGYVFLRRVPGVALTEDDFRRAFDLHELDFPTAPDAPTGSYGRSGHAIARHADSKSLHDLLGDIVSFNVTGNVPGSVRSRVLEGSRRAG
jgi:biotin carboxylase